MSNAPSTPRGFVYHLADDNPARILQATASARNAIAALGPDVRVDILAQGGSVRGAATFADEAADLKEALASLPTVQVWLCSLAAQGNGLTQVDFIDGVNLAATATAHAAQRQFEGWAYVRG